MAEMSVETPKRKSKSTLSAVEEIEVKDGCLFIKNGSEEKKLTNWVPKVMGAVYSNGTLEGFVLEHAPSTETDDNRIKKWRSHLTMKQLSSFHAIVSGLKNKNSLYTAQFCYQRNDQWLPDFILRLTDQFMSNDDFVKLEPIKHQGRQDNGCWVYAVEDGARFFRVIEGQLMEVSEVESALFVTGESFTRNLKLNDDLNKGFKELINFAKIKSANNFPAAIQVFSAAAMALHYKTLINHFGHIPMPLVISTAAGTGKTTITKLAMRAIGIEGSIHDPTKAGILDLLSSSYLPMWWEDVEDFSVLETLVFMVFNHSERSKFEKNSNPPCTMPVATTNGLFLDKVKGNAFQRFEERVIFIPFRDRQQPKNNLLQELIFSKEVGNTKEKASSSFMGFLNLALEIPTLLEDPMINSISRLLEEEKIFDTRDTRSVRNYGLLLYFTAKILQKCGYSEDEISEINKSFMTDFVAPYLKSIKNTTDDVDVKVHLIAMLKKAATLPEAKWYQRYAKSTLESCEDCLAVSLSNINRITAYNLTEAQLRNFKFTIENDKELGCGMKKKRMLTGKIENGRKQQINCVHVKLSILGEFYQRFYKEGDGKVNEEMAAENSVEPEGNTEEIERAEPGNAMETEGIANETEEKTETTANENEENREEEEVKEENAIATDSKGKSRKRRKKTEEEKLTDALTVRVDQDRNKKKK